MTQACARWVAMALSVAWLGGCAGESGGGGTTDTPGGQDTDVAVGDVADTADAIAPDPGATDPGPDPDDVELPPSDGTADQDIAPDAPVATTLEWGECPEFFSTECAHVELPLDWSQPDGQKISVMVARRPAADPNAPQLWLLQGGPGGSGGTFYKGIEAIAEKTGMSIYTLDHRGVGHSTRLGCGDPGWVLPGDMADCLATVQAEWGPGLDHFTTTAAARDLGALIDLTRSPGQKAFVYGVSYGAYWAMRHLQIFPSQPAGVVLDSIPTPGVEFFTRYDGYYDPVAQELMALCAADDPCRSRLGADPWSSLQQLYAMLDAGHCPALFEKTTARKNLRNILGSLLEDWYGRVYALAFVYRLYRCNAADQQALTHLRKHVFVPDPERARLGALFSHVLFWHVALAEMWEEPAPTTAELEARIAPLLFSKDLALGNPVHDQWPVYPQDEYVGQFPDTQVPVLMLQGTLDPQTPKDLAAVTATHLTAPHQTFILVPGSPHGVALQSLVKTAGADPCGMQIVRSFLADPTGTPDTTCLADLAPVPFSFPAETNQLWLGTDDLWENAPATSPPMPLPASPLPRVPPWMLLAR